MKRFWTEDLYAWIERDSAQALWTKEESPWLEPGECQFSTAKDRAKYLNIQRDPSISIMVDDPVSHKYVVAYGRAEIIEQGQEELLRPILKKYMPAERVEPFVQNILKDPKRFIVRLQPEKVLTN